MLNEIEALLVNGYTLKSITECNGEIFAFLLNESDLKKVAEDNCSSNSGIPSTLLKPNSGEKIIPLRLFELKTCNGLRYFGRKLMRLLSQI